ncbi:MAG: hypothetical protein WDK95_06125 [Syntrophorhabdaceae bacterium]
MNLKQLRNKLGVKYRKWKKDELIEEAMSYGDLEFCPICNDLHKIGWCCGSCGFAGKDKKEVSIYTENKYEYYKIEDVPYE